MVTEEKRQAAIRFVREQIKTILIEAAVEDELPMDMTQLDSEMFNPCIVPLVDGLITLQEDARWALEGNWDRGDEGFEAQVELVKDILFNTEK